MMATIENPHITIEDLNKIEEQIKQNKAKSEDYEKLDNYLFFISSNKYIITKLKENKIDTYEDFIYQRRVAPGSVINMLVGGVMGVIAVLRRHISGK